MHYFSGASGRAYIYGPIDSETVMAPAWPMPAGNFIFVRKIQNEIDILHVGEAEDVWQTITQTSLWVYAKERGANFIYAHPSNDPLARAAEKLDLVIQWKPPMNRG